MNQEQQSLPQESIEQMFAAFGLETEAQRQIVLSQGVAFTAPEPQLVIETRLSTNAGSAQTVNIQEHPNAKLESPSR